MERLRLQLGEHELMAATPIKIHYADTEKESRARHEQIQARLNELGKDNVSLLVASGGLPTEWNPIIRSWMSGEKLEPEKVA